MSNVFDRIFKEESVILIKAIATKVLGVGNFSNTQPVTASLHKTLEREPDWLRRVCHANPKHDYIFHGEVHGKDEAVILDRNLVYFSLLWQGYHLPIHQVVVYIGRKKKLKNMISTLNIHNMNYQFDIINMNKVPYAYFINSSVPEEVMLAILCDFKKKRAEYIITQILMRLKQLNTSPLNLQKNIVQLEIISKLRKLQPLLTKILDDMPFVFDIRKDLRFKEGKQDERLAKDQFFVINLFQKGIQSLETIAEFADVELSFVLKTKTAYLAALPLLKNGKKTLQDIADITGLKLEVVEKIKKKMP